ncbi:MAG: hypothetical protein Q8T08_06545 [Ignavibacteria bacterium]|nr:hypothetical protein [Ignavibacteria bacterium]
MTPFFKTGKRKYLMHFTRIVNGERYETQKTIETQSEKHARATLLSIQNDELDIEIHSIIRIS